MQQHEARKYWKEKTEEIKAIQPIQHMENNTAPAITKPENTITEQPKEEVKPVETLTKTDNLIKKG